MTTETVDWRQGRWEEVLADVGEVDALICDPPYSARTHGRKRESQRRDGGKLTDISYAHWDDFDVAHFVASWAPRVRGWWAVMTSHDLAPAWERALDETAGLYVFAPLPCVLRGMSVRLAGDGPSSWTVWLIVARPRHAPYSKWGTLPGAYTMGAVTDPDSRIGGKPEKLMRSIVSDYTRPGDLIVDPCGGHATTLLAARALGRRAIGAEMDPEAYEAGARRLARPYSPDLFAGGA